MDEQTITKAVTIRDFIHKPRIAQQIGAVLPEFMKADRFLKVFYSALMVQPKLLDCTQSSLLSAMIQSGQLGLEPILGKAALIPYNNKRGDQWFLEAQFQPMYRGLCDLARRSQKTIISGHVVYEKDKFEIVYGTEERIVFVPDFLAESLSSRGRKLGAFTVWRFPDDEQVTIKFMPWADIMDVRDKYSKAWKSKGKTSPWGMREDEMAVKTVVKNHAKLQPCSIEMDFAVNLDNRLDAGASTVGQFAPTDRLPEIEEKFKETAHELDKVPVGDMQFVDPDTGEVTAKEKPKEPTLSERIMDQVITPSGIPSDRAFLFIKKNAEADKVTQDDYMEKLLEYKNDAIMALRRWHKAAPKEDKKVSPEGQTASQMGQTASSEDYYQQYKHKRFAKNPKDGLLGWVVIGDPATQTGTLEKISKWPESEKAKLKSIMLRRGYGPDQVPDEIKAKPEVAPDQGGDPLTQGGAESPKGGSPAPVGNPPANLEQDLEPLANDEITRRMKTVVEERIASTETDLDLNFNGFVGVLDALVNPDEYENLFQVMKAVLLGEIKFDDVWMNYERSLTAGGPVER